MTKPPTEKQYAGDRIRLNELYRRMKLLGARVSTAGLFAAPRIWCSYFAPNVTAKIQGQRQRRSDRRSPGPDSPYDSLLCKIDQTATNTATDVDLPTHPPREARASIPRIPPNAAAEPRIFSNQFSR